VAFRLKPHARLSAEVRRLLDRELRLAARSLRRAGSPRRDRAIHEVRRHVKKARAVLRLFRAPLGQRGRRANRRLRTISRMLAPITNGEAIIETFERASRQAPRRLPPESVAAVRAGLVHHELRVDEQAKCDRVVEDARSLLEAERRRLRGWRAPVPGFAAIAPGLARTYGDARRAQRLIGRRFTPDRGHRWRRRVKDHWYEMRLLEGRCGRALAVDRRRLEALDDRLGEYDDCVILEQVLRDGAFVSRPTGVRALAAVRRYRAQLEREARRLGRDIYRQPPRQAVNRLRRLWR
jgi:hypothetical protein